VGATIADHEREITAVYGCSSEFDAVVWGALEVVRWMATRFGISRRQGRK